jgi:hypothetical protein
MRHSRLRSTLPALIGLCSVGCGYDNGPVTQSYNSNSGGGGVGIAVADIDADATMSNVEPGRLGMFIEYATGGTWTVKFTCDTPETNIPCPWSINAQTLNKSAISGLDVHQLDSGEDLVRQPSPDLLMYDGITTGLPIGFDVWLQYEPNPNRYVFWIGDGGLNRGISSPSFDLYPPPPPNQ